MPEKQIIEKRPSFRKYERPGYYVLQILKKPEEVYNLIKKLLKTFPDHEIILEKLTRYTRENTNINLKEFLLYLKKSNNLIGTGIKSEKPLGKKFPSNKNVLTFFTSGVIIDKEDHCIWINITDNPKNRKKIEELLTSK